MTPTTGNNLPTSSDEINFYKLNWGDNISIAGIKQALYNYEFHNKNTGTSVVELVGNGGQRATVILSHSGKNYYAGVVISYYFFDTYIQYNNGTWN